jgi:hypothetical protein
MPHLPGIPPFLPVWAGSCIVAGSGRETSFAQGPFDGEPARERVDQKDIWVYNSSGLILDSKQALGA